MIAGLTAHAPSGRSGLTEAEVNIATFLTLMQRLDAGEKMNVNKRQVQLAFAKYVVENDLGKRGQSKDLDGLIKFAVQEVNRHKKIFDQSSGMDKKKRAEYLEANGLTLPKELPENLREKKLTQEQRTDKKLNTAQRGIGIVMDVLELAHASTNPAMAVAMVIAADAMGAGMNSIAHKSAQILTEALQHHAKTPEEKRVCMLGLRKVMGDPQKRAQKDELQKVQKKELESKNGTIEAVIALEELTPDAEPERLETALEVEEEVAEKQVFIAARSKQELATLAFKDTGNELTQSLAAQALQNPELAQTPAFEKPDYSNNPFYIDPHLKLKMPPLQARQIIQEETA